MMFSSNSFAEWVKVTRTVNGDTFYVDYERIRKHDGFVSFWMLRLSEKQRILSSLCLANSLSLNLPLMV